jgi:hypothetical protein
MGDEPRNNGAKTPRPMPEGRRFEPGNPGRPKGSRNRLGEAFIQALANDFDEHGVAAIATVREDRPHEYLKVVASLLPKQVEIKEGAFDGIGDEELSALIVAARAALGVADEGGSGIKAEGKPKSARGVQTLQ